MPARSTVQSLVIPPTECLYGFQNVWNSIWISQISTCRHRIVLFYITNIMTVLGVMWSQSADLTALLLSPVCLELLERSERWWREEWFYKQNMETKIPINVKCYACTHEIQRRIVAKLMRHHCKTIGNHFLCMEFLSEVFHCGKWALVGLTEFWSLIQRNKLSGFSPQTNYTDRATASCRPI
jgi:hypothetical protein